MPPDEAGQPRSTPDHRALLNANQRRHFEVLFSMMEDALTRVETRVGPGGVSRNALNSYQDDVPHGIERAVFEEVAELRRDIAAIAESFALAPSVRSRRQALQALLVAEIVRLDDSFSNRLGGYGPVHPLLQSTLDPTLLRMRTHFETVLRVLKQATREGSAAEPAPPSAGTDVRGSA